MNNRDIEIVNLDYNNLKYKTTQLISNAEQVNVEVLLFAISLTRIKGSVKPKNFTCRTCLVRWIKENSFNRSEVINNYHYYHNFIKYILFELYRENKIEYAQGNIIWKSEKIQMDKNPILNIVKNANFSEVRKVLNED